MSVWAVRRPAAISSINVKPLFQSFTEGDDGAGAAPIGNRRKKWSNGEVLQLLKDTKKGPVEAADMITESLLRIPFRKRSEEAEARIAARKEKYRKRITHLLTAVRKDHKGFERKKKDQVH